MMNQFRRKKYYSVFIAIACAVFLRSQTSNAATTSSIKLESYSVTRMASDPGLAINRFSYIVPPTGNVELELALGVTEQLALFNVGTQELAVDGDDVVEKPFSVELLFSDSYGTYEVDFFGASYGTGPPGIGHIRFGQPVLLPFGYNGTGQLEFQMSPISFDTPGDAKAVLSMTLLQDPVPEPSSLLMIVIASLITVLLYKRKK